MIHYWSHDALRQPIWEGHPGAPPELPFAVYLPYVDLEFSAEHDAENDPWQGVPGLASFGRPTPESLARWTGGCWRFDVELPTKLVRKIAAYDCGLDELENPQIRTKSGTRQRAMRKADVINRDLRAVLDAGLERRYGTQLERIELHTFVQIATRLPPSFRKAGLQVCESCDLVFRAAQSNARKCGRCRRRPARKLHPKTGGGYHTGTTGRPGDGTFRYFVECTACKSPIRFSTPDPRTQLCPDCGSNAGRQRRFRGQSTDDQPITEQRFDCCPPGDERPTRPGPTTASLPGAG